MPPEGTNTHLSFSTDASSSVAPVAGGNKSYKEDCPHLHPISSIHHTQEKTKIKIKTKKIEIQNLHFLVDGSN